MNEPTITCPHCANEIKLTESLAAPLIRATRLEYEAKILQKEVDVSQREAALRHQQKTLEDSQKQLDEQISARLKVERITIAADEAKKKRVQASIVQVRQKAKQEVEDDLKLKVTEKEAQITSMQRQIDELKRKA